MTSTVRVSAHCSDNKEVRVTLTDENGTVEEITLQNGETAERAIFDSRAIHAVEVEK